MHQILVLLLAVLAVVSSRDCPMPCICRKLGPRSGRVKADCSNQYLYSLPKFNASSNVDEVDASGNNFDAIREASFRGMQNVATLNLSSSNISDVSGDAFKSLSRLWVLDLSYNKLKSLPQYSFLENRKLDTLILRGNPLGSVGLGFYGGTVKKLDIRECGIGPPLMLNFPMLRSLKLDSNKLHYLSPTFFDKTPYIRYLSIKDIDMKILPVNALNSLRNLTDLNVDNNPLGLLPKLSLETLETLSARNCSLMEVASKAMEGLPNLRYLQLQQNNITTLSLPEQLDLVSLNLSGNPLVCNCEMKPLFQWLVARDVLTDASCGDSWGERFTEAMMDLQCDALPAAKPHDEDVVETSAGVYVAVGLVVVLLCAVAVVLVVYWNRIRMVLFTVGRRGFDSMPLHPGDDSL